MKGFKIVDKIKGKTIKENLSEIELESYFEENREDFYKYEIYNDANQLCKVVDNVSRMTFNI